MGGEIKRGETTSSEGYDNKSSSCRKPRDEEAYQHIPRVSLKSTQAATSTVKSVHSTEEDDLDEEERAAQAKKEQKAKLRADEMAALDAMELKDTINAKMAALKKGKFRKQRHRQTITDHVAGEFRYSAIDVER